MKIGDFLSSDQLKDLNFAVGCLRCSHTATKKSCVFPTKVWHPGARWLTLKVLRHRGSAGCTCLKCVTDGEHDKTACTSLPLGGVFPGRTELEPECCRLTGLYCLITHAEWTQTGCVHEQQKNESPLDWTCYQHWVGSVPADNIGSVEIQRGSRSESDPPDELSHSLEHL